MEISTFFLDLFKNRFINVNKEESKFENTVKRYLKDWETSTHNNLDKTIHKALEGLTPEEILAISSVKIGSLPKRLASLSAAAAQKGVERAYTDLNLLLTWNINMTPIADYYLQHYDEFSKILSSDLQDRIKEMIATSVKEGTPTEEVHKQIAEIYAGPVTIKVPEKVVDNKIIRRVYEYEMNKDTYTTAVARTEIQRALNNGRVYGYQESGIAKTLKWTTNPGACEECVARNGAIYNVEDTQDLIPYHVNCRCTWVVGEYKSYEESQQGPSVLSNTEELYANPDGIHVMELVKLAAEGKADNIIKLIDEGKIEEALKIIATKATGSK
jgi:SPP1 gp7 family putative phage head morphogenesis protein